MEATQHRSGNETTAVLWGLAFSGVNVAVPVAIWWLDAATVHALL